LLLGALACTPSSPPDASGDAAPTVMLGSGRPVAPVSAAATTELPDKEPPFAPCAAQMFDHQPGQHGLFGFEDSAGKHGFRGADGKQVIAPRFRFAYPFSPEGVAAVVDDDGPAFIDTAGRVLGRAFIYDNGPDYFTEGRARIVRDARVGFIDRRGRVVIEPRYAYAGAFCHERAAVCDGCRLAAGEHGEWEGGRWGFIDRHGRLVVPMKYDAVTPYADGRAEVVLKGKRLVIDKAGKPAR